MDWWWIGDDDTWNFDHICSVVQPADGTILEFYFGPVGKAKNKSEFFLLDFIG